MKIIHTADWHLGKLVHGVYMTEQQEAVLEQFIELVATEQPDAVIIAGDLYDRSVPPVEAVQLLEKMLFRINVELKTPVLAISGNHDSAERLSFGSSWYRNSGFYLNGKISDSLEPVRVKGVNFYLVPYAEPGVVRELFQDSSIQSHHDAMGRVTWEIEKTMDADAANILVGHAFVTGGKTTDSERILSVGGSGSVDSECFSPFTYTALGHLHSPDAIRHETIRYSGSLLKYSFSEAKQRKSISIIEIDASGQLTINEKALIPPQDMREISGYIDELLDPAFYETQKLDDFLKVTLLDEGALLDPINKLRAVYPNILHLERKIEMVDLEKRQTIKSVQRDRKTELDLFSEFYKEMTTSDFTEQKRDLMNEVIDSVRKEVLLV
ncbi:MAG TPA: exonuclease SbcCD subunit D [Bacillus bacterium]|uniref:exonuclease SbcCD subunit D n=1 Tax=Siminovitchia fordii TaxID=254759 RepID=UPI00052777F4|nr:exonuclease SbcCD subunit D [Siminovitchia fordii]HBZ10602.1 exonuclease SbcCD subunit D [Bacillus sp. (in: firmicutes)]